MINLVPKNDHINILLDKGASIRGTIFEPSSPPTRRRITKLVRCIKSNNNNKPAIAKDSCQRGLSRNNVSSGSVDTDRMKKLDGSFTPGIYDVICARGAAAKNHNGNIDLKSKVIEVGDSYARAPSKVYKSLIVSSVIEWVRSRSPNGGFVKKMKDGKWYEVGDEVAREKVGQALRDLNHGHYKSSMRAKRQRWKNEKQQYQNTSVACPPQLQLRQPPAQEQPPQVQSQTQILPPEQLLPPPVQSIMPSLPPKITQSGDHRNETFFQTILQSQQPLIESSMQNVQQRWFQIGGSNADDEQLLEVFAQNNIYLLESLKQATDAQLHLQQEDQEEQDDFDMMLESFF